LSSAAIRGRSSASPPRSAKTLLPSAAAAADAVQALIADLGLPQRISAFGLSDGDLVEAVRPLAGKELAEAELLGIMRAAY
jgi:hypothetical protein